MSSDAGKLLGRREGAAFAGLRSRCADGVRHFCSVWSSRRSLERADGRPLHSEYRRRAKLTLRDCTQSRWMGAREAAASTSARPLAALRLLRIPAVGHTFGIHTTPSQEIGSTGARNAQRAGVVLYARRARTATPPMLALRNCSRRFGHRRRPARKMNLHTSAFPRREHQTRTTRATFLPRRPHHVLSCMTGPLSILTLFTAAAPGHGSDGPRGGKLRD